MHLINLPHRQIPIARRCIGRIDVENPIFYRHGIYKNPLVIVDLLQLGTVSFHPVQNTVCTKINPVPIYQKILRIDIAQLLVIAPIQIRDMDPFFVGGIINSVLRVKRSPVDSALSMIQNRPLIGYLSQAPGV